MFLGVLGDRMTVGLVVLAIGALLLAAPTFIETARVSWSTDIGGHGPIVLATGGWLLWREWRRIKPISSPPPLWRPLVLLAIFLPLFVLSRITGVVEFEAIALYAALLVGVYAMHGGEVLRKLWFPFAYLALALPPPESVVATVTQPMKLGISEAAVSLLHMFGMPIGNTGVSIQVAQYELLVAAACAGLNSIISLGAVCLFYAYIRHRSDMRYLVLLGLLIVPIALFANFIRVLMLILITYYMGEAAGQGFLHDFAGLTMFMVALLTIFALDRLLYPYFGKNKDEAALTPAGAVNG